MLRKAEQPIAYMEKVLAVRIESQTIYSVPLNQRLIHRKAITLFSSVKAERGEKTSVEKFEASRG